ncbi:MAG: DUF1801 domain-containing protein [Chitinophagaceae bacterium]|nr:DUF1801 domain-containing protein [Chitinophagaceae bacterium]
MNETTTTKYTTVQEYISSLPAKSKAIVKELRKTIQQAAPEAEEVISYNMPSFQYEGGLVYYAAWRDHISIYPRTAALEKALKKELAPYAASKGTLKFPLSEPVPFALISKIVKIRLQENIDKIKKKAKK